VISCCNRLNKARRVFIFAGPGISTSAGIPDLGSDKWLFDSSKTPEDVLDGHRLVASMNTTSDVN
jgi:NAD-dependent SIR2 family protein deacetylase